jgi:hypothetical protein
MEIKGECSNCGQHFLLDESVIGQQFTCPHCKQTVTACAVASGNPPVFPREVKTNVKQSAALGGWICFGIAVVVLFIPLPTWFVYGPLFFVSFILAIVAMTQGRVASGLTLLLMNIFGFPVLFFAAILLGLGTWNKIATAAIQASATNVVAQNQANNPTTITTPATITTAPLVPQNGEIEGAFGEKLGDAFDPDSAADTNSLTDGTILYEFSPPANFRSFEHYYVMITPQSHKIYGITAMGNFDNTDQAKKEQAVVMEILKEKYGPEQVQGISDAMDNVERITQGNRYVLTKVSGFTDGTLDLRYYDSDLAQVAEQERIAGEVQNTDTNSL